MVGGKRGGGGVQGGGMRLTDMTAKVSTAERQRLEQAIHSIKIKMWL